MNRGRYNQRNDKRKDVRLADDYRTFTYQKYCGVGHENQHVLFDKYTNIRQLYEFGDEIGRGVTGIVKQCMDRRTGDVAACKSIVKASLFTSMDVEDLKAESRILQQMQGSPYVVRFYGAYEDSHVRI